MIICEIIDVSKRSIHLSKERWAHITSEHPEISGYLDRIQETLKQPLKRTLLDEQLAYYYAYVKERKSPARHLLVIVKYLNGTGFIITAYFVRNIR